MSATDRQMLTFVDTNIWLYAFNDTQNVLKTQQAKHVIRETLQIVLSSQVVNEVCSNMLRKFGADEADVRATLSPRCVRRVRHHARAAHTHGVQGCV